MVISTKNLGTVNHSAHFYFLLAMPEEDNNNEELRPTKMRGVVFPKAKYGVIIAVIIIISINLVIFIFSVRYKVSKCYEGTTPISTRIPLIIFIL